MKSVLQECLEKLIEENKRIRGLVEDKEFLSSPMYARALCTIELNMGRGAGHTTAIKNLADPKKDLIVTNFPNDFLGMDMYIVTPHNIYEKLAGRKMNYERVYVDGADNIFQWILGKANFYEYFSIHGEKTYIFLG